MTNFRHCATLNKVNSMLYTNSSSTQNPTILLTIPKYLSCFLLPISQLPRSTHRIAMALTTIKGAPSPLIWINGYPGTGKLTVAKGIAALSSQVIVLDNHQLIDPVEAKFSRSHPRYQEERRIFRISTLAHYNSDLSLTSHIIVCTGKIPYKKSVQSIPLTNL